jgi:hypothetical protein
MLWRRLKTRDEESRISEGDGIMDDDCMVYDDDTPVEEK